MVANNKKIHSLKFNAALNVIKQICMIIFPMITFPYASRVLGKFYYGKINFSSSIISYISLIAELGITKYAIREGSKLRNNKEKINAFCNEVFSINMLSTSFAYIILFALIAFWRKLDGYTALLLIQGLSVLFTTIGTDWINSIYEDYLYITIRYIICQSISLILMLVLVKSPNDYLWYAFVCVSSSILANLLNVSYIRRTFGLNIRLTFHLNLKKHLQPVLIMFGTSIASLIYINSDVTLLGILKDENEVGLYSVSAKIYTLVKNLLNAMLVVTIPRISHDIISIKKNELDNILSSIFGNLIIIVVPACIGLLMLSKPIVLLISGKDFYQAYSSLEILSLALVFATVACFYINVVMIPFKMEGKVFIATGFSAVLNIVLNVLLIPYFGQDAAAFTTLLSEFVMMICGICYTRHIMSLHIKKSCFIGFINGIITLLICRIVLVTNIGAFLTIIVSFVFSVLGCAFILLIIDKDRFYSLSNIIFKRIKKK